MVCPPATSEAKARWPRFGLVVVATTSRRNNKDQMIRPYEPEIKYWRLDTSKNVYDVTMAVGNAMMYVQR
jgi:hypothetical protein